MKWGVVLSEKLCIKSKQSFVGNKVALVSSPLKANGLSGAGNSFGPTFAFKSRQTQAVVVV